MNISISEIIVILLVALLVIKPEQLPDVAHSLGKWTKRAKDMMAKLRQEVDGTVNRLTQDALPEKIEFKDESSKS